MYAPKKSPNFFKPIELPPWGEVGGEHAADQVQVDDPAAPVNSLVGVMTFRFGAGVALVMVMVVVMVFVGRGVRALKNSDWQNP